LPAASRLKALTVLVPSAGESWKVVGLTVTHEPEP